MQGDRPLTWRRSRRDPTQQASTFPPGVAAASGRWDTDTAPLSSTTLVATRISCRPPVHPPLLECEAGGRRGVHGATGGGVADRLARSTVLAGLVSNHGGQLVRSI